MHQNTKSARLIVVCKRTLMTAGIMKLLMPCELKILKNNLKKNFLCLKTKTNNEMNDEEHSVSEFYYSEEQKTAEKH